MVQIEAHLSIYGLISKCDCSSSIVEETYSNKEINPIQSTACSRALNDSKTKFYEMRSSESRILAQHLDSGINYFYNILE